jgi:ubiquinone/menaquinone biosynthesis C-methylase UbiE
VEEICWATPLYEFVRLCEASGLDRMVLDCGAGGSDPPLALFRARGYRTCGVEVQDEQLAKARRYCRERGMQLSIFRGDMRHLPFADASFPFVYAYNAVFFMTKPDVVRAMGEIERVLAPDGLCYVNFRAMEDADWRPFPAHTYAARVFGSEHFAHHDDAEVDALFAGFEMLRREKCWIDKLHDGRRYQEVLIECFARKRRST